MTTNDKNVGALVLLLLAGLVAAPGAAGLVGERTDRPAEPRAELVAAPAEADASRVGYPQYPSISPDGRTVAFSWAGDLWAVDSAGGTAQRLTTHTAYELRSAFSPDGSMLAFDSQRDGPRADLYVMPLERDERGLVPGPIRRVTRSDWTHTLGGFSADGEHLLFSSWQDMTLHRSPRMFRVPLDAEAPAERLTEAHGTAPVMAPDGSVILFTRGRYDPTRPKYTGSAAADIYRMELGDPGGDAAGDNGEPHERFARLTAHSGHDAEPFALPDGSVVVVSARQGHYNLWRLRPATTDDDSDSLTQLTFFAPAPEEASEGHGVRDLSISPGGWHAVFVVWDTIYVMDLRETKPEPRPVEVRAGGDYGRLDYRRMNLDREVQEAALSPDGRTLAVAARGEVFVRSTDPGRPTRRVTDSPARKRDLAWSPDGRVLYFASDREGVYGLYGATVALAREDLLGDDEPGPAPADEAPASHDDPEPGPQPADPDPTDQVDSEPADPADAGAADPDEATTEQDRVGEGDDADRDADADDEDADEPGSEMVDHGKRWAQSLRFDVKPVSVGAEDRRRPAPSPDGRSLLYTRGLGDLVLLDLEGGDERVLLESWNAPEVTWAGDSRHIVYAVTDLNFSSDIWLMDTRNPGDGNADGEPEREGERADPSRGPINLTRHPDRDIAPRLSADGKVLVFLSDRDADARWRYDVYAVNLDRRLDGLRPYELADHFEEAADAAKQRKPLDPTGEADDDEADPAEPFTFDAHDAFRRIRRLVATPAGATALEITPGGDRVIYAAEVDGSPALYSVDHRGDDRRTLVTGEASQVSASLTGDKVLHVRRGEAWTVPPGGGEATRLDIDAPVTIDLTAQRRQKFREAARLVGDRFYHPTLKGLDWDALVRRYEPLALATRTDGAFNRVLGDLFGHLDGSHLGVSGGEHLAGDAEPIGYLGVQTRPVADGYEVTRVLFGSPADRASSRLEEGDVIMAVGGQSLARPDADGTGNLRPRLLDMKRALAGTAGKETLLELRRDRRPNPTYVLIVPAGTSQARNFRYEDRVTRNAAFVEELSDGRLGYIHLRGMNMESVRDFERDLYASAHGKDGLVIDVRDNGGGFTTDILLTSLTAPRHAYTIPRGADPAAVPEDAYPRDRRFIYAYTRPINVLINHNSFSNAEIFAHAIKTIGRGTLIGTPTFGAVISTGSESLIDGTRVRTPFRGWYLPDGTDMENHGAVPDILVEQGPADEAAGRDPQLQAAVEELLQRLDDGDA